MFKAAARMLVLASIGVFGAQVAQAQIRSGCPLPGTKSPQTQSPASVKITNSSYQRAQIYWVDFNGNSVRYTEIGRGQSYNVNSYLGHRWVVMDERGRCVAHFTIVGSGEYDL